MADPTLDEAERLRLALSVAAHDPAMIGVQTADLRVVMAEYDRRGAALAERDAEIARLRAVVAASEELQRCWTDRSLTADYPVSDARVGRDLVQALKEHRRVLRALAAAPAPTEDEVRPDRAPSAESDPDTGRAYFIDLVRRFGRCTCDPIDDGFGGWFGECTGEDRSGCALCKRLDPDWPCPTSEHHGYEQITAAAEVES
jgi:hypothetical protein